MLDQVLPLWGFEKDCMAVPFGNGLINHTWKVVSGTEAYILQRINDQVFRNPEAIAKNISLISAYLAANAPQYVFPAPVKTRTRTEMAYLPGLGYFRVFPFLKNTHTITVVASPKQAFEAAKAFGRFTKTLSRFDASRLAVTIPHFHDLELRYRQLETANQNATPERSGQAQQLFQNLMQHHGIVDEYKRLTCSNHFKVRVTHHDTKISNVLFDDKDNSVCVIDLDTVMPGYFISDVGDMLRTYLSPVGEEEKDVSKVQIRDAYFEAIVQGYLSEMHTELTETEKLAFVFAGKFLIYMQAVRFLTDFLNNDMYYGAQYAGHNLVRAQNQAALLQRLCEREAVLQQLVTSAVSQI